MSWVQRINNQLQITIGTRTFEPNWVKAVLEQEYNLSEYNYPEVKGTFVDRRMSKGRKFSFSLFFQGDDHLDVADDFMKTSEDTTTPWSVNHPLYDQIIVQPSRIRLDNSNQNVSILTVTATETITRTGSEFVSSGRQIIVDNKDLLDAITLDDFEAQMKSIGASDIAASAASVEAIAPAGIAAISEESEKIEFKNKIVAAQRDIINLIGEPRAAFASIQESIEFPFIVASSVKARVDSAVEMFERVVESFGNLTGLSRNDKVNLSSQASMIASGAAIASVTNLDEFPYESRTRVNSTFETVLSLGNSYIDLINSLETDTQTDVESFAMNPDVVDGVQLVIDTTLQQLVDIAFNSSQEFSIRNEEDSNPMLLTHRFYGLDSDDENLNKFIVTNGIGSNEMLIIKKDREIIYYK